MSQSVLRAILGLTAVNVVVASAAFYQANLKLERNYEEMEARMDELEGTLRGHIGIIEESLERIEGKAEGDAGEGWGKGMGKKAEEMYMKRGRDEKKRPGKEVGNR